MSNDLTHALAESLELIERQGLTVEECLARYPEHRTELAALLAVARLSREAPPVRPSPAFRALGRQRLMQQIRRRPDRLETFHALLRSIGQVFNSTTLARRPAVTWILIIATVISLLGGGGAVYASGDALPNDVLYPLKTTIEEMRLTLSASDLGDGELHLAFAAERLEEVARLLEAGRGAEAGVALHNLALQMQAAVTLAQTAPQAADREALAALVNEALNKHELTLAEVQARLPDEAQAAAQLALESSGQGRASVQLAMLREAEDSGTQASLHLQFAAERLAAASAFAAMGREDLASRALGEYGADIAAVLALIESASGAAERETLAAMLGQALSVHDTVLSAVEGLVPPEAQPAIQHAREVSGKGQEAVDSTTDGEQPSVTPTELPSGAPTDMPAAAPTSVPAGQPTGVPTGAPTDVPQAQPTAVPTSVPTGAPPTPPTQVPGASPTDVPGGTPGGRP